jgi:hypothetical protein
VRLDASAGNYRKPFALIAPYACTRWLSPAGSRLRGGSMRTRSSTLAHQPALRTEGSRSRLRWADIEILSARAGGLVSARGHWRAIREISRVDPEPLSLLQ